MCECNGGAGEFSRSEDFYLRQLNGGTDRSIDRPDTFDRLNSTINSLVGRHRPGMTFNCTLSLASIECLIVKDDDSKDVLSFLSSVRSFTFLYPTRLEGRHQCNSERGRSFVRSFALFRRSKTETCLWSQYRPYLLPRSTCIGSLTERARVRKATCTFH